MKAVFAAGSDNVGDELNEWVWPALVGDIQREGVALLGIGTLLNKDFCCRLADARSIQVLGSGAGYGAPPATDRRWHFHAVRGLHTARALGLDPSCAVADSAYLLASLDWHGGQPAHGDVVVVPHHRSLRYLDWQGVCQRAGVRLVSPLLPAAAFMQAIAGARLVLSEAMHGAILADIARVPWQGFAFGAQFNQDKWLDWADMFDLDLDIRCLPGFYDTNCFSEGRPLRYHLGKLLKARLSRAGLGREKWQRMTLPSLRVNRAEAGLVRQLGELAGLPGMLSGEARLRMRVDQLYQRVDELRAALQAPPGRRLQGDGLAFLAERSAA